MVKLKSKTSRLKHLMLFVIIANFWSDFSYAAIREIASSIPSTVETPIDICFGKEDASVTIIEYSALNCPHCAHFHTTIFPKLKEKYIDTGQVKLIFRHFPIDHKAFTAALVIVSLPADLRVKFLNEIFQNQDKYFGNDSDLKLSQLAGIKEMDFKACISNQDLQDQVLKQRLTAEKDYHVDGAPTFFLDGKKYPGTLPLEEVEKILNRKNTSVKPVN
jgi:protein-disulfide isomerase